MIRIDTKTKINYFANLIADALHYLAIFFFQIIDIKIFFINIKLSIILTHPSFLLHPLFVKVILQNYFKIAYLLYINLIRLRKWNSYHCTIITEDKVHFKIVK